MQAVERGLGPLLCSSVLIDEALGDGRVQRLQGPALPGFAYRLVELQPTQARRSLHLFRNWLLDEAARSG